MQFNRDDSTTSRRFGKKVFRKVSSRDIVCHAEEKRVNVKASIHVIL
jgi:hypothetical protein